VSRTSGRPELVELGDGLAAWTRAGDGDTLLWFHGYTMDSTIWLELWRRLPSFSHVGVDFPGHGASRPLRRGEDLPALARRIGELALERGIRHLVALSFGTMVALQVAIEHPRAFASLVLGAPALGGGPQDALVARRYGEVAFARRKLGPGPHLTALWMRSPPDVFKGAESRPALWERLAAVIDRHGWSELDDGGMQPLAAHRQVEADFARVGAATLVLVGEHDLAMSKLSADLLMCRLPACRRVDLPGLGHLCLVEAPERTAGLVERHVRAAACVRRPA
jgi:pimeloyl-ACP methyl ester carboxylesterase